mmetsp:Transcript_18381/g.18466  ORF Transcript_18381/g.18466 Transcript_18381/m.18466 type:complete len:324 (+) Transcript_18381:354-1325(+)
MQTKKKFSTRTLLESDKCELKEIHEELFPVRYSDTFYDDACNGKGPNGKELFSCIISTQEAGTGREIIAGFILAQHLNIEECDGGIFPSNHSPKQVCYILTIGIRVSYRREKLGSMLISHTCSFARRNLQCGGVYLHVIYYNRAAIMFYERMGFHYLKELEDFYSLSDGRYNAYLYAFYLNGYNAPLSCRIYNSFIKFLVKSSKSIRLCVAYALSSLPFPTLPLLSTSRDTLSLSHSPSHSHSPSPSSSPSLSLSLYTVTSPMQLLSNSTAFEYELSQVERGKSLSPRSGESGTEMTSSGLCTGGKLEHTLHHLENDSLLKIL